MYKTSCEEFENASSGEMASPLKTRFLEYCRSSATSSEVSKHLHADCPGHSIKLESAKILDQEAHLYERGMKEAISIRAY